MTNKDILIEFMKNHSNQEAANYFHVNVRTIARWLKKINYNYYDLKIGKNIALSQDQLDIINGSLLGDGCISQNRFNLKQKSSQFEYIQYIYNSLNPFSSNITHGVSKLNNKLFGYKQFYTHTHPIFKTMKQIWYVDKQKIVPDNLILNPKIFTHWFVQDGTHRYSHRYYVLSTQSFTSTDVDKLILFIERDLHLKSHKVCRNSQWEIVINTSDYEKTFNILYSNIQWDCFKYKADPLKIKKIKTWLGANKLSKDKANEIRNLHEQKNYSIKQLAKLFKVSESSIRNILNNVTYKVEKPSNVKLGGSSTLEVIYNPSIADSVLAL